MVYTHIHLFYMFFFLLQGETYTLLMVDPDAPNHKAGEAWLHWILSNVEVFFLVYREGEIKIEREE